MFYASYGSFMHELIEDYYNGRKTKDEMLVSFLTEFEEKVKGKRPKDSIVENYIKKGIAYLENFEPFRFKKVSIEEKVDFEINGHKFTGRIDYLGEDEDDFVIVDNKSRNLKPRSKREKPTVKDMELDSMLKQLYLYAEGVRQKYGKLPKLLCFNCFKAGVFIEEPFDMERYKEVLEWASKKVEEIAETEDWYPNEDFFTCNNLCGVSEYCCYHQASKKSKWRK